MRFADISIRIKLIATSIIIGIVPLIVAGLYGQWLVTNSLIDQSFDKLVTIQSLRKKQVETSFKKFFNDLETLSASERLGSLVTELEAFRQQAEIPSSSPFTVQNPEYLKIIEKYRSSYADYIQTYGYHDMKVISSLSGHVMFTVGGGRDLGANLVYGRYKDSGLAAVWQEVLNTGKVAVVDFASYEPSDGLVSLFIGTPIYNDTGTLKSVVVLQLDPSFINAIMDAREGMGGTGESYLIRWFGTTEQFEFRSNVTTMGDSNYIVGYKLKQTPQYWKDAVSASFDTGQDIYTDSAGNEVLVAYDRLDISGFEWYQISKIDRSEVTEPIRKLISNALPVILCLCLFIIGCAWIFSRRIVRPVIADVEFAKAISAGNLDASLELQQKDELGVLASTLNQMAVNLRELDWLKRGKEGLDDQLRGEVDLETLGSRCISYMVGHMGGQLGAFYLFQDNVLELVASHAFTDRGGNFNRIQLGEGLVGQATLERRMIVFSNVKDDTPEYNFGVAQKAPKHFMVAPLLFEGKILGAFLIGSFLEFSPLDRKFVKKNLESIAIFINMARSRRTIEKLYEQARGQQEELLAANKGLEEQTRALKDSEAELQAQQEELRVINEELEERTKALQKSQSESQAQQEELRVTNENLQERTETLERQKASLRQKTSDLIKAQKEIENKAKELERGSKYKSEFLANMSHELRTPLNSILILSQLLGANTHNNLDDKQIESAKAIHSSGSELLTLINEILDLSKVEAGKIDLYFEKVELQHLVADVKRLFREIAEEKGLNFDITIEDTLPETIYTDAQRVQQILRNLLTNAFKFTHRGTVSLTVSRPRASLMVDQSQAESMVAFAVQDEGIGIPGRQQQEIFNAFQQADGSTSRTYGGTGLGLSISKELTRLLGGTIHLESREGEGSVFTFVLPQKIDERGISEQEESENTALDLEGDIGRRICADTAGVVVASRQSQEDRCRREPVDKIERSREDIRKLLVVEDDRVQAESIEQLVANIEMSTTIVRTGSEALTELATGDYDCMILDLGLADMTGFELLDQINNSPVNRTVPVVVYTGRDLTREQEGKLRKYTDSIIIKGVKSPERLLEELSLFLHRMRSSQPPQQLEKDPGEYRKDGVFSGKTILVVDDDMRNVFALTNLLEDKGVQVIVARDGVESLDKIALHEEIDLVLMDIMMPKMDGYQAISRIREQPEHKELPIIALTAKAMKGDRTKCIEAGASDYLAKPVDTEKMISILKVWLY
ncbi:MAG: response regulator [Desulforhopalus sp.]